LSFIEDQHLVGDHAFEGTETIQTASSVPTSRAPARAADRTATELR
jgi:hypothetical protein